MKVFINIIRRKMMNRITKNIGSAAKEGKLAPIERDKVKNVLVLRPNHRLGNLLLITPLVQEISRTFPDCKINLFVKGNLAPIIFENYEDVDRFIKLPKKHFKQLLLYVKGWLTLKSKRYDLVINVVENSSSGRLSTIFSRSDYKYYGVKENETQAKYQDFGHMAKYPVYNLRNYLSKLGIPDQGMEVPLLDLKLAPSELAKGKQILNGLVKNEAKTICIFTHATGLKCYSESWWLEFSDKLKNEFPDYNLVEVLPVENISKIGFKEITFYSKDVREIGAVIANASVFIGADSGIMHLASAAKTPTIGLFHVTHPEMYQPYGNGSTGVDTNKTDFKGITLEIKKALGE